MKSISDATRDLHNAGISPELYSKWQSLVDGLSKLESALVAYSGGVDSSFLAAVTAMVLGKRMTAMTIASPVEPPEQTEFAAEFARQQGFQQVVIAHDPLQNPNFRQNPVDRCYHCKLEILHMAWDFAQRNRIQVVLEGQNADDQKVYRPGRKAVTETGALSPLAGYGLTKADIRWLARNLGLPVWDKPSSPCLATRFPYGTIITDHGLQQVYQAETYLRQKGFRIVRVRCHGDLARIEVEIDQLPRLLEIRPELVEHFKQIGFKNITLDLQGFRSGSFDEGFAR